jgi:hypothetical protein
VIFSLWKNHFVAAGSGHSGWRMWVYDTMWQKHLLPLSYLLLPEKSCEKEEFQEKTTVLDLPPEIMLKIFTHLNPKDLCRSAQVCKSWSEVAMDGKLWQEVHPVRWAQGWLKLSTKSDLYTEGTAILSVLWKKFFNYLIRTGFFLEKLDFPLKMPMVESKN